MPKTHHQTYKRPPKENKQYKKQREINEQPSQTKIYEQNINSLNRITCKWNNVSNKEKIIYGTLILLGFGFTTVALCKFLPIVIAEFI